MLERRSDTQARTLLLARVLALHASWEIIDADGRIIRDGSVTRPTWAVLMGQTGLSRSTVAAHLAWLRQIGLLGLVAHGTTSDHSPAILATSDNEGNEAAVYVLCSPALLRLVAVSHPDDLGAEHVHDGRDLPTDPTTGAPRDDITLDPYTGEIHDPTDPSPQPAPPPTPAPNPEAPTPPRPEEPVDETRTPTGFSFVCNPPTRATNLDPNGAGLRPALTGPSPRCPVTAGNIPEVPRWPLGSTPAGRKERQAAAAALQAALPVLGRVSTAHIAHLAREWFLAGWTPQDILTALNRQPDGTPWRHSTDIRHLPGWIRHRLTPWRVDPTNPTNPTSPPSRPPPHPRRRRSRPPACPRPRQTRPPRHRSRHPQSRQHHRHPHRRQHRGLIL